MDFPKNLKYTENDEWVRVEGSKGTIGITEYAQEQLSDIVFVEITASIGDVLSKGDSCASVESVKAAAEVYMPVGGTVTETNEALADEPEKVNTSPYDEAWLLKIELADASELDALMDADAYAKLCEERG
ncbi:MAG: glycine cleavage system protein GcvH [Anaerolineales bacterium]|nr:glycine cleavage system protein GcvH [Anaerolineales bacterium]